MAEAPVPLATLIHMVTIKLTSTNYLLWKSQVEPMLRCDSLFSFVDGSTVEPPPTVKDAQNNDIPNPEFSTWHKRHDRALSLLLSSLTEESMSEVVEIGRARDVWVALEAAFSHSSPSRAHHLRDELQLLKRGTSSVSNYGRTFKGLCDQLAAIGHPVPDVDKGHWFLRGLGPHFRAFADVRMTLTPHISFNELLQQAQTYELNDKAMGDDANPPAAAFYANRSGSGYFNSGRGTGGRCKTHGGPSGGKGRGNSFSGNGNNYPSNGNTNIYAGPQSGKKPYVPRCQICRGPHYANHCPSRYSRDAPTSAANLAQAFEARCTVSPSSQPDWYLDIGASAHMSSSPADLDAIEPYNDSSNKGDTSKRQV